jgi:hypothetical protein
LTESASEIPMRGTLAHTAAAHRRLPPDPSLFPFLTSICHTGWPHGLAFANPVDLDRHAKQNIAEDEGTGTCPAASPPVVCRVIALFLLSYYDIPPVPSHIRIVLSAHNYPQPSKWNPHVLFRRNLTPVILSSPTPVGHNHNHPLHSSQVRAWFLKSRARR